MKLKLSLVAFLFMIMTSAFAYFPGQVYTSQFPNQITSQVYNPHYEPIFCQGQVFGRTWNGLVAQAAFFPQIVPPGQYRFAYVYAQFPNRFVQGWSNIFCRFLR